MNSLFFLIETCFSNHDIILFKKNNDFEKKNILTKTKKKNMNKKNEFLLKIYIFLYLIRII